MSEVYELPVGSQPGRTRRWGKSLLSASLAVARVTGANLRKVGIPALEHLREHGYSVIGLGFVDSACFVHSLFTGLIVTGISFLVFEWKVSSDG
jgi:hypothetical protein